MQTIAIEIKGTAPLMMHSDALVDPAHPLKRKMAQITSKHAKKKTDDDFDEVKRLEFQAGMYWDKELGPYLPGELVQAAIRDGAKMNRLGQEITRSVLVPETKVPLRYGSDVDSGQMRMARDMESLWNAGYYDTRSVVVSRARVLRTRPCFDKWAASFQVHLDDEHLNFDDFLAALLNAGKRTGIGDYRPRYGRFDISAINGEAQP